MMPEPVPALDSIARRHETPCGAGRMVWREWGAGPALVLLHGGTGSWRHWAATIADFAATHRVLAPDLPGLGESDPPDEPSSPRSIGAIVAAGIDAILGIGETYDLCGFSFGAMISSQVAVIHGARVRTLTIVGPGALGLDRPAIKLEKVRSRTGDERREANRTNLGIFMLARPERISEEALAIQDWNTVHARYKSRGFAHTPTLRDAVAVVPAKVNAIWGENDVTAFPTLAARIAVLREARPDVDLAIIPHAGHWAAYDAPAEFNALLRAMLSRPSPA
jgi:pimeloyl-ACP methyl ester carboxylesterase